MIHTLTDLGRPPETLASLPEAHVLTRVVADHGTRYHVHCESGRRSAWLPPTVRLPDDGPQRPAIGDWVVIDPRGDEPVFITGIVPRTTELARQATGLATAKQVIAANVDRVLVVASMNKDLNVSRLERLVAAVEASGAQPVVVIHKADLDPTGERRIRARLGALVDLVDVVFTSVVLPDGLSPLDPYLGPGVTLALVGSSGVGKSTLVNHLLGHEAQSTQSQRLDDDRGRHTTTARSLHVLPDGRGVLIDTPGMRELALWSGDGLSAAFADIEALAERCQYRSCNHDGDFGCAIEAALASGELDARRWENHLKLEREAAYHARRAAGTERQRGRSFAKYVRSLKKEVW